MSIAWMKGVVQKRVGNGPWMSDDRDVLLEILDAGATTGRSVLLDPEPDVPYGDALRLHRLCRSWNLHESDFRIPVYQDPGPRSWGPVTADEAEKLGRALEEAVAAGTPEAFDRSLALQEMLRRMIGDATLSVPMQRMVENMFRFQALSAKSLVKAAESSRPLKFLRVKTVDGSPRPFFRVLTPTTIDYAELELGKGKDGTVLVLDVRRFTTDGSQNLALRRTCMVPKEALKILNVLLAPTPGDIASFYRECWELNDLAMEGKVDEALKYFSDHREAFRKDRWGHQSHMNIAQKAGPDAFAKAIADFDEDLPQDSLLLVLRIEGAIATQKHDQALAAIDALDKIVGEDPFLLIVRANIELSRGHARAAKDLAARATEKEPMLDRAWWALLNSSVPDKDYASAVRALDALEKKLKIKVPDLRKSLPFEEFVESPEFLDWSKSRK